MKKNFLIISTLFLSIFLIIITNLCQGLVIVNLQGTNTKTINPTDKAIFPIEITNDHIVSTNVSIELVSVPEGWIVVIRDSIIIDADSTSTIYLTAIPPRGFGFHDDEAIIKIMVSCF